MHSSFLQSYSSPSSSYGSRPFYPSTTTTYSKPGSSSKFSLSFGSFGSSSLNPFYNYKPFSTSYNKPYSTSTSYYPSKPKPSSSTTYYTSSSSNYKPYPTYNDKLTPTFTSGSSYYKPYKPVTSATSGPIKEVQTTSTTGISKIFYEYVLIRIYQGLYF